MRSKVTPYRIRCARRLSGRILDIGAGEGDFTPYLEGELVSVDIDLENLKGIDGSKVVCSAPSLPFPDSTFDGIWSCAVLEHVLVNYIPESIRVAKLGAVIYILTPNRHSPYDPIKRLFGLGDWMSCEGHVRLYSAADLRRYGEVSGEVWWFPPLDLLSRVVPALGHTLMLKIEVTEALKSRQFVD